MKSEKRVAVLTLYYHNWNMGGMLQAYGLNKCINDMGFTADYIPIEFYYDFDYQPKALKSIVIRAIRSWRVSSDCLDWIQTRRLSEHRKLSNFRSFHNQMICSKCRMVFRSDNISKLNNKYSAFVAGSDQIWNPVLHHDGTLKMFGLTFADSSKRTISYAASIGSEKAAVGKEYLFREILSGLDYISVREQAAKDFLQPLTDKPVAVVLDPTLLLTQEQWQQILLTKRENSGYVFSYFLEESPSPHEQQLWQIAGQLPIWCISDEDGRYCREQDRQIWDAGPIEFVNYIANAEMIITNSFHGMVFSLVFRKPFWVMKRFKDTDEGSMNNRIVDFLREFGLEDRMLEDGEVPDAERLSRQIDYDNIGRTLEQKRTESLQWLENALVGK